MGFFLIFFPEEEEDDEINTKKLKPSITFNTLLRRTSSVHLVSKAQSTISICALLVFFSLLLFTLSTFEPTATPSTFNRRQLTSIKLYKPKPRPIQTVHAFQGMGRLYTRGSRAMNSLIICHVMDSVSVDELELFLRLGLRSSLTSRSDLLFVFPSGKSNVYNYVVRQENDSFLELITRFKESNESTESQASFDATQFVKSSEKMKGSVETIWGRKIRSGNFTGENETELTQLSYGSVVGFEVDELDPENSLAGFMDHVPLSLRRWACYTLLLGRLRRKFKHVMLVDVKDVLLLGDPLGRVKNQSPESVYLSTIASVSVHMHTPYLLVFPTTSLPYPLLILFITNMNFHYTYIIIPLLILLFIFTVQSSARDLRPSDHGLTFQNTSSVTASPDATTFFGGTKSKVPLPEAKNLTDVTWRRSDSVRRDSGGVNKAWLVTSLVCGVTGIALLSVAAFVFIFRLQMESKQSPISD